MAQITTSKSHILNNKNYLNSKETRILFID